MEEKTKQVVISRTLPAGIERVWKAFTVPEDILKWQSPVGMTTPVAELDLKVGGKYAITMQYDETGEKVTVRGVFKVIEKPTKLVYTWKWDNSEEETEVTFMFSKVSESETILTLIHSGFSLTPRESDLANNWTHESHLAGWTTALDKFEKLVTS